MLRGSDGGDEELASASQVTGAEGSVGEGGEEGGGGSQAGALWRRAHLVGIARAAFQTGMYSGVVQTFPLMNRVRSCLGLRPVPDGVVQVRDEREDACSR